MYMRLTLREKEMADMFEQMSNDKKEMVDIICGKFFICYAPPESESFQSLPDDMMKKYKEQFKYPERFSKEVGGNIVAEPFKPKSKDYER